MKRTTVKLTLLFIHRDHRYRSKVTEWLSTHAATVGVQLVVRHADRLGHARHLLGTANRVLVDGTVTDVSNSINRGDQALPIYALVERLDAVAAYNFLNRGVIPVGRCDTELDAVFLTYTILEGVMVARTPDVKGRHAAEQVIQERVTITKTLAEQRFNVRATARFLGRPHSTLQYQMKKLGIVGKPER